MLIFEDNLIIQSYLLEGILCNSPVDYEGSLKQSQCIQLPALPRDSLISSWMFAFHISFNLPFGYSLSFCQTAQFVSALASVPFLFHSSLELKFFQIRLSLFQVRAAHNSVRGNDLSVGNAPQHTIRLYSISLFNFTTFPYISF